MRALRRTGVTSTLIVLTLLTASAVVSAEPAPSTAPVAITQPLGTLSTGALGFLGKVMIPEAGLLLLVGSGLMGLAAVVRRATRA